MKLSKAQKRILLVLHQGSTLKSHRYLDGAKVYKLHPLDGPAKTVKKTPVQILRLRGLIYSNHKFPVATYLLSDKGQKVAAALAKATTFPRV